ncbi:lipoprotein [Spiroplasma alleghenense]|uniref:Lipoprotein n=1 Tax=Spiroplasma alleghenense TaxID=216931 RepID=A0A345Z570_9MOLU|nr:lipoprotein [Spiroplasma alleghenense]AXK51749.1 hypothetical protein SALLE_v1c10790 [Spiroplasma alleghenense]
MKKLLAILGATTLVVAAPLSVVACKKKVNPNISDEFDYQALKNELMDKASEIFYRNLDEDFGNYKNMADEDAINTFDFIRLENIAGQDENPDLKDSNSDFFKAISKDINSIIDFNKLNKEINDEIVNQLNYKPVIQGIGNPFQSYELNNIAIKTQSEIVSLSFDYIANLKLVVNEKGDFQNEAISFRWTFNIFESVDLANEIKSLNDSIRKGISQASNGFLYEQDSGNLKTNAQDIIDKKIIENQVQEVIEKTNTNSKFEIKTENHKFAVNQKLTQDGSIANTKFNYSLEIQENWDPEHEDNNSNDYYYQDYSYPDWWDELMKPVLSKEKGANEKFIKKITEPGQKWVDHQLPIKIVEKISNNSDIVVSEAINHYNLAENILSSDFEKRVKNSGYEFKIDEKIDFKSIAVYGAEFSKSEVEIKNLSELTKIELDTFFVPIKQNTTFNNTKLLYEEFLRAAIEFQQSYLLNDLEGEITLKDNNTYNWEDWGRKHRYYVIDAKGEVEDYIIQNHKNTTYKYQETIKRSIELKVEEESNQNLKFIESSDFSSGNNLGYSSFSSMILNSNPTFLGGNFESYPFAIAAPIDFVTGNLSTPEFRTYFFSSGLKFNSSKTYFSFGKRGDLVCFEGGTSRYIVNGRKMLFNFGL